MDAGEPVKPRVHGVEHVDDLDGLAGRADVGESDHVTEENGAHFKLTCGGKAFSLLVSAPPTVHFPLQHPVCRGSDSMNVPASTFFPSFS